MRVRTLLAIVAWLTAGPVLAEVTARVDANPVLVGEAFRLEIIATGSGDGEPDLTDLEADFRVLNRSSGSRYSIINGRSERSRNWTVTLVPRRTGELTIPGMAVDGESSQPIRLRVREPDPNSDDPKLALVEMEVTPASVYVGQPVQITVRVLLNGDFVSSSLNDPAADNAVIERIGEQIERSELRGNNRYRVFERRYIAFPESAGELQLTSPVFQGEVNLRRGQRTPLGLDLFGGPRQPVVATAADRRVPVQAPPAGAERPWLPSTRVRLAERLIPADGDYRVGEPLTRELRLEVEGQLHTQLEPITSEYPDAFQAYADEPESETLAAPDGIRATQTRRWALIPGRAGEIELPAVRVPWWDVDANRQRYAEVPARTITVLPAAGGAGRGPGGSTPAGPVRDGATAGPQMPIGAVPDSGSNDAASRWRALALVALIGWLLTALAWLRSRRRAESTAVPVEPRRESEAVARKLLERALGDGDARRSRAALLRWGACRFGADAVRGIADLQARCTDPAHVSALAELDAAAFAPGREWSPDTISAVRRALSELSGGEGQPANDPLPPLYPAGRADRR